MNFWGLKTCCLVTGASRGIGKTIAIEFSKHVAPGSLFILLARSVEGLEATKETILSATEGKGINVHTVAMDLLHPSADEYANLISSALEEVQETATSFKHALLVHNAGSLGNAQRRVIEMNNLTEIQNYWTINITSMMMLTSEFFRVFNEKDSSILERSVVQITSLAGVEPFKCWGYYCAGKACRDMIMKTLAAEESTIQVISWAPGPVDTDMFLEACRDTGDQSVSEIMNETLTSGKVLSPLTTVTKLIAVLENKQFVKGEHVDYFDVDV